MVNFKVPKTNQHGSKVLGAYFEVVIASVGCWFSTFCDRREIGYNDVPIAANHAVMLDGCTIETRRVRRGTTKRLSFNALHET
jgi:hypothetical protein